MDEQGVYGDEEELVKVDVATDLHPAVKQVEDSSHAAQDGCADPRAASQSRGEQGCERKAVEQQERRERGAPAVPVVATHLTAAEEQGAAAQDQRGREEEGRSDAPEKSAPARSRFGAASGPAEDAAGETGDESDRRAIAQEGAELRPADT